MPFLHAHTDSPCSPIGSNKSDGILRPGRKQDLPVLAPLAVADPQIQAGLPQGNLTGYLRILRRRMMALLAAALLGGVVGYISTLSDVPIYQARASLEVQSVNENFVYLRDVNPNSGTSGTPEADLQTQVNVIQSESVIERALRDLESRHRPIVDTAPDLFSRLGKALRHSESAGAATREEKIPLFGQDLKVSVKPNSRLVEVRFDSPDARFAADFANTLVAAYIEHNREARWQTIQSTGAWLGTQMRGLKSKLEIAENELHAYAQASGLGPTTEKGGVAEEKLRGIQQELSRANSERIARQSKYELAIATSPKEIPEILDNAVLREYQLKLTDLRSQLAELSQTLMPENPKVLKLNAQIKNLETSFDRESVDIIGRIGNEYEAARRREALLEADYAAQTRVTAELGSRIGHYETLKRVVDNTRQLYETMVQRVNEAGIASALHASNIRVVDAATTPRRPYRPRVLLNTLVGLLIGVMAGMLVVVHRERSDRSIRDPGEAAVYLDTCELGVIPSGMSRALYRPRSRSGDSQPLLLAASSESPAPEAYTGKSGVPLISHMPKATLFADSFRAVVTSILFSGKQSEQPGVIVVTSTSAGEGKTTVVCNLGLTLAEIGMRVLLIDGDCCRRQLRRVFGLDGETGLSDLLDNSMPLQSIGVQTRFENLRVLSSGGFDKAKLLYSSRLTELLNMARQQNDVVLVDTPPMLLMPDARLFGRLADGVILVLRSGITPVDAAMMARQRLADDGTRVLGIILNDWNPANSDQLGYKQSYKSYERYRNGR